MELKLLFLILLKITKGIYLFTFRQESNSIISGSATENLYAYQTIQLNVQAVDDFGNNITTGGDKYVVEIKNECTITGHFTCRTVSGATTVVNPEIKTYMTDNGNGTYSYSFMLTQSGKITILVYFEPPNPVFFELWPNLNLDGAILESRWYPNINNSWTSGSVASTYIVDVSGRFTTYLTPPIDDTYTIYYYHDNAGRIYFEGIKEIDDWGVGVTTQSFTIAMKAGQNYKVIAELNDYGLPAKAYII